MSDQDTTWPLPKFYFSVTGIPGNPTFQDVTGLAAETHVNQYVAGNSAIFSPPKMPPLRTPGNVTFKKGIFVTDALLWTWFNGIAMNTVAPSTIVVTLLDQTGAAKITWTLDGAFPTKLVGTDLKSDGNEVAVERIEIAYQTMTTAMLT